MIKIESFDGEYRFLSNFWPAPVFLDTVEYPTVEHAYQAAKFVEGTGLRPKIFAAEHPALAKQIARANHLAIRPDFHKVKYNLMNHLCYQKFTQHKLLGDMLRATGTAELIEGNWWGDTYWGVCRGKGHNHLGKILMTIRAEISNV